MFNVRRTYFQGSYHNYYSNSFCTGVSDVQNFVSLSLATAAGGEGDLVDDKLSHLRALGGGLASLLYHLPENSGTVELSKALEPVWSVIDDNKELPVILVSSKQLIGNFS